LTDLDAFLRRFVLPLVAGGEVHVGTPIAPDTVTRWEAELGSAAEALVAVDDARAAALAALVVRPPPLAFDGDDLRLTVALYSALVLSHPRSDGWLKRRGRRELASYARDLAAAEPPADRAGLLGRHALLGRVFELTRRDTIVRWWTGKAEFRGEPPPQRLLRWRRVRRVKEEATDVPVGEVIAGDDGRATIAALVRGSPLTDLLTLPLAARRHPPFRWGAQIAALRDPELARAVSYTWLADLFRDDPEARSGQWRTLRAPAAAAIAWEQTLATPLEIMPRPRLKEPDAPGGPRLVQLLVPARAAPPLSAADVRAATAFLVHLNALAALAEVGLPDPDAPSPLVASSLLAKRGVEIGAADASGARLFFCVPDVAARCEPALAVPPGLAAEPRLARRWAAHRTQVRQALGEERLAQLARRLAACV
jgi:hypothetical protein